MVTTEPSPLSLRTLIRTDWRYLALLAALPCLFFALVVLPAPFGLDRDFGNDFGDHRIWWVQMDAFWLSHGQVPLWNPVDQFGILHVGARGMAAYYPPRWWLYVPAIWMPQLNYGAQYLQLALHLAFALTGIFVLLRRHTRATPGAAAFAAMPFLLTQRVVDFVRYPQGIEATAWLPWILVAALECLRADLPFDYRTRWAWRLAAATALGFLAAYGHLTYMGGLFIGVVLLAAARSWQELLLPVGAAIAGLLAAAGSLYPLAIETAAAAGRSGGDPAWANQFLAPGYGETWMRPFAAEIHGSAFFPPVYLILLAGGVVVSLAQGPRRLSFGMLAALALIADLARGSNGLLFGWCYEHLPMFHVFRNHGRGCWPALMSVAYFSAVSLAWLERDARRSLVAMLVTVLAAGALGFLAWHAKGPPLLPAGHFGYSALELNWITPDAARWAYVIVLAAGVLGLGACLTRRGYWQIAGCAVMVAAFVLGFAQFSTWLVTRRPVSAETRLSEAYPRGLFAPYEARPAGILGIWGMDDPPLPHYRRYVELQPAPDATFPASRFYFLPAAAGSESAEVRVKAFDANHFDFEVRSQTAGTLVYLARASRHARANVAWRPWPQGEDLFLSFDVVPGTRSIAISFVPVAVAAAGLFSLCATTALVALAIDPRLRSGWSRGVGIAGLCVAGFFVNGTLRHHPLDARLLAGPATASPFEWHAVPRAPQASGSP